jgi:hypothetical protein
MIDPALRGDLLDERARGRSRAWYWRQVAFAIGRSIFDQARLHPVLTLRAIATMLGVYFAASVMVFFAYGYLSGYLSPGLADPQSTRWFLIPLIVLPWRERIGSVRKQPSLPLFLYGVRWECRSTPGFRWPSSLV